MIKKNFEKQATLEFSKTISNFQLVLEAFNEEVELDILVYLTKD